MLTTDEPPSESASDCEDSDYEYSVIHVECRDWMLLRYLFEFCEHSFGNMEGWKQSKLTNATTVTSTAYSTDTA